MDEYLKPNASFIRLLDEYKKYGSLYVGFDFDGTVHDYHKKGQIYEMVVDLLKELKWIDCKVICWTAYEDHEYVKQYCEIENIPLDGINIDGIKLPWESRKPFYSVLLDDRAGLIQTYQELSLLVYLVLKGYLK